MMIALALVLNAAILVSAFVTGLMIRRGSRRQCIVVCAVGLALCLAKGFLVRRPDIETRLFPWPNYVLFSGWNGALAMLVVGAMAGLVRRRRDWIFLGIAGLVSLGYFGDHLFWVGSAGSDRSLGRLASVVSRGEPNGGRTGALSLPRPSPRPVQALVRQTTAYTCGAAAAATMLRTIGISTDEREMAALCLTRPGRGTLDLGLYRGLNVKLQEAGADLRVRIEKFTFEELARAPKPCILRVHFNYDHTIVVMWMSRDRLVIFDPSAPGRYFTWDRQALVEEAGWEGYTFVFHWPSAARPRPARPAPRFELPPLWIEHDRRDDPGV